MENFNWMEQLKSTVEQRPILMLRFSDEEWHRIGEESPHGTSQFTINRPKNMVENLRIPTACLVAGYADDKPRMHFAKVSSKSKSGNLDALLKVKHCAPIGAESEPEIEEALSGKTYKTSFRKRTTGKHSVTVLAPKLSVQIINGLAKAEQNIPVMRKVAVTLRELKGFHTNEGIQADGIEVALKACGLRKDESAVSIAIKGNRQTALDRFSVYENNVVNHDAQNFPGFERINSDITGEAVFKNGEQTLRIYTANAVPLEDAFGVDLIYFNEDTKSIVMLQYKMLERRHDEDGDSDWYLKQDARLQRQIEKMKKFALKTRSDTGYRFNCEIHYLKLIRREAVRKRGASIIMPLSHYDHVSKLPISRGPKGGLRMSFQGLKGQYLREHAFTDLVRSGYIGSHAESTRSLLTLIQGVLREGHAVVAAIQSARPMER